MTAKSIKIECCKTCKNEARLVRQGQQYWVECAPLLGGGKKRCWIGPSRDSEEQAVVAWNNLHGPVSVQKERYNGTDAWDLANQEAIDKLLSDVVGVVDVDSFGKFSLWERNNQSEKPLKWKENLSGLLVTVGYINDSPVCISLSTAEIDGNKYLFIDPTSMFVDYGMIDGWLKDNLPKSAFKQGDRMNKENGDNFHNVLRSRAAA